MALEQLHKVTARPVSLGDDAKTQENFDFSQNGSPYQNKTMGKGNDTNKGVLGGSIGAMDTDGTLKKCTETLRAMGLFGHDAAGEDFESNRPKDSGVITLVSLGFHFVDIYETRNKANGGDLTYVSGETLYSSGNGLLTNEDWGSALVVGVVETAPSALGEKMLIKLLV